VRIAARISTGLDHYHSGYVTGANNQLSSDGKYSYTYDDEGNLRMRRKRLP
jgi:hypothetical protein